MNKKTIAVIAVILGSIALIGGGIAFAYFSVAVGGSGNTKNNTSTITTVKLGTIIYNGQSTFTSEEMYPGMMGLQTFTIGPDSQSGTGTYEIDLAGTLPEAFGTDVEITLYKTTAPDNNNVSITEGTLSNSDGQISKEDELVVTGTPDVVYGPVALTNESQIVLETANYNTDTLSETTYYLVYNYKNNGNQNDQQGLTFSGTVTVRLLVGPQGEIATTKIANLLATNTDTMNNDDPDGNVRYMGSSPNNYVTFNGETNWRIIGVFNVKNATTGVTEQRMKIIRDTIGNYSWDSSASGINGGFGINEWSQADIMTTLNSGAYWNRTSGTCYNAYQNGTTTCDFSSTGLTAEAKAMISDTAVWNLGTTTNDWSSSSNRTETASQMYAFERSTNNGKICSSGTYCNDSVTRTTTWNGKVGLMYPSDYTYATSGGSTTSRATCLNTALYSWNGSSYDDCHNNSWLYNSSLNQWTLTPVPYSSLAGNVFRVYSSGLVTGYTADLAAAVRPTVYLNADVKITGGTGAVGDEFQLSL